MRQALASLPGVRQVRINFDERYAVLLVASDQYDPSAILGALAQVGYSGRVMNDR